MESVLLARRVARVWRCPWVLDIKDNWELYVPYGMRRVMAYRSRGWKAITANSRFTQEKARTWQRTDATVIYSGVDHAFIEAGRSTERDNRTFRLALVGSLYSRDAVSRLLIGLRQWINALAPQERRSVSLHYYGSDHRLLSEAITASAVKLAVDVAGHQRAPELARSCSLAAVNLYVSHSGGFHSKLLELLACGKPVVAFPREGQESLDLAIRVGGDLRVIEGPAQLASELVSLHAGWKEKAGRTAASPVMDAFTWRSQSSVLEAVLENVVRRYSSRNE
jgi:glycosyltransferase involved in cell wall biosynthesis